jgi:hypothetical protein
VLIPANVAVLTAMVLAVAGIILFGVYPGPLYAAVRAAVVGM